MYHLDVLQGVLLAKLYNYEIIFGNVHNEIIKQCCCIQHFICMSCHKRHIMRDITNYRRMMYTGVQSVVCLSVQMMCSELGKKYILAK